MQVQDLLKSQHHRPADALRRVALEGMLRGVWDMVRLRPVCVDGGKLV